MTRSCPSGPPSRRGRRAWATSAWTWPPSTPRRTPTRTRRRTSAHCHGPTATDVDQADGGERDRRGRPPTAPGGDHPVSGPLVGGREPGGVGAARALGRRGARGRHGSAAQRPRRTVRRRSRPADGGRHRRPAHGCPSSPAGPAPGRRPRWPASWRCWRPRRLPPGDARRWWPSPRRPGRRRHGSRMPSARAPVPWRSTRNGGTASGPCPAGRVHRLLGFNPGNRTRFRHDRLNRLPHDVVVVDETSMVSLSLMARLLEAVRSRRAPDARGRPRAAGLGRGRGRPG